MQDAARDAGSARSYVEARSADGSVRGTLGYEYGHDDLRASGVLEVSGAVSLEVGVVVADSTLYLEIPPIYRIFAGAAWVRVPAEDGSTIGRDSADGDEPGAADAVGADDQLDSLLETLESGVPGQALSRVTGSSTGDVELVALGTRTYDGRVLEGYSAQADLDGSVVTLVHWIDDDDLLYVLEQSVDDPLTLEPATSVTTFDDWGAPVAVETPDPTDVTDLPDGLL